MQLIKDARRLRRWRTKCLYPNPPPVHRLKSRIQLDQTIERLEYALLGGKKQARAAGIILFTPEPLFRGADKLEHPSLKNIASFTLMPTTTKAEAAHEPFQPKEFARRPQAIPDSAQVRPSGNSCLLPATPAARVCSSEC